MSLLVHYTLKSADHHDQQIQAMTTFVESLKAEQILGLNYSCFSTDDPTRFVGVLEFPDDATKDAFLASKAFAAYRETVGPIFANPPEASAMSAIATTRA